MALPTGVDEQEVERQPSRGSGGEIDRALLLDRARGGVVMEAGIEVVDHPQLPQGLAGTVDEFHLERDAVAHAAHERAGDRHEHRFLAADGGGENTGGEDGEQES